MKKLFIAAMALATIVSCSKDEGDTFLTSNKKSVAITIANSQMGTRGGAAGVTSQVDKNEYAASVDQLTVLFLNNSEKIVESYKLSAGTEENTTADTQGVITKRFHGVNESVNKVAVVRYNGSVAAGTEYSTIVAAAKNEAATAFSAPATETEPGTTPEGTTNLNTDVQSIILTSGQAVTLAEGTGDKAECEYTNEKGETHKYKLYTATVEVAPAFARLEIHSVAVTNLGQVTNANGTVTGVDEVKLGLLTFGGGEAGPYTYNFTDVTFWGNFKSKMSGTWAASNADNTVTSWTPATDKAISWNMLPTAVSAPTYTVAEGVETISNPMVLNVTVDAADMYIQDKTRTVTVKGLKNGETPVTTFEAGKVYTLNLVFDESNISAPDVAQICVEATVKVSQWTVVPVTPEFK